MAAKHSEERQEILYAESENTLLFQKLIRKQRGNLAGCVDELHVSSEVYKGDGVLSGWYEHFKTLSSSSESQSFDQDYHHLVLMDTNEIEDICHAQGQLSAQVTKEEVKKAIKELNKGKAADAMGITAEHFVYAEDSIIDSLRLILNKLFESGQVAVEIWLNYTCI